MSKPTMLELAIKEWGVARDALSDMYAATYLSRSFDRNFVAAVRELYDVDKSRADNADTLPSFAAVQRAKKEGRIIVEQGIEDGSLTIVGVDAGTWVWSFLGGLSGYEQ